MHYDLHECEEHFMMIAMEQKPTKWSYDLHVMARLINLI
jgi:hypothetical protein